MQHYVPTIIILCLHVLRASSQLTSTYVIQVFTDFVIVHLVDYCPRSARFDLATVRWACCEFQGVDGLASTCS